MDAIANQPSIALFSRGAFAGGRSLQAEQTRVGSVSRNLSTDITITTDEGDTVTLRMASAIGVNAGIRQSDSHEDAWGASSQTEFFEFSTSQDMAVEVAGDLNEAELKDIRQAVKVIGSMIDDFLAGDLQEMARDGELLKEMDTISSMDAAFSYERQVLYGEQEKVRISGMAPENGNHSHSHPRGQGRLQRLMDRIDRLTDDMAAQVNGFRDHRRRLGRSVEELLGRYRDGEMDRVPTDPFVRDVIQTMQTAFVQKLQTLSESAGFNLAYAA